MVKVMEIKNIIKNKKCSGCMSCVNICPKAAIKIEKIDGFEYPYIDEEICIKCGKCNIACPIINKLEEKQYLQKVYAAKNKNTDIRMQSSSGGIFTLVAEWVLENNGVVFGAKFNDKLEVVHDYIENKEQIELLRGSKYLQSKIGLSYSKVKEFLENGRKVLFTGTPCQIEGLLSFLNKKYDNLYTQDIVCHGVPSPLVWKKYLEYKKFPKQINFRNKEQTGWTNYQVQYKYESNKELVDHKKDSYMKLFLKNLDLRESCYSCSFKKIIRNSDITIADFWGINAVNAEFNDEKGISAIIINSEKGLEIFNKINSKIEFIEEDIKNIIKYNSCICNSAAYNEKRKEFFEELKENDFEYIMKKYLENN
jgi:coenzyme F420-reducing hydrogenase beta subunit